MPTPRLLKLQKASVLRAVAGGNGYYDEDGEWVEPTTNAPQDLEIPCNIQPLSGEDLKQLPESFKNTETAWIYTPVQLFTIDEKSHTDADIITYDNKEYVVHEVSYWRHLNTRHYKALLVRKEKS
jgi:hypothetical protein